MTERISFNAKIAERIIKRTIQALTVENIDFDIMALDKHLVSIVKDCKTHKDMLFTAANNGLVYEGERMVDNENIYAEDIDATWGDESVDIDCDPCIRARVGEKVCEISGLTEMLEEALALDAELAKEEEKLRLKAIDGDKLSELPEDLVIDEMNDTEAIYETLEEEAVANANY